MALCGLLIAHAGQDVKERVKEFKGTDIGRKFLSTHSERDLEKVIMFLDDPKGYFLEIQNIKSVGAYFDAYDYYLWHKEHKSSFIDLLHYKFQTVDVDKAEILTFLRLNYRSGGINSEDLTRTYADLFKSYPAVFIKVLEKRKDWKLVVDSLQMDWSLFKEGVAKLGNSAFEKEFKAYVREYEEQIRKHRHSN